MVIQKKSLIFHPDLATNRTMNDDDNDEEFSLRYDLMVESALRGVMRVAIEAVIDHKGLPGNHHFFITFITSHPGVRLPIYLRERYPHEMTIVLQYQFSDLYVDDEMMAVTLSFNNIPERLEIPLSAITIFADPSKNFALQFQPVGESEEDDFPDGGDDDDSPSGGDDKGGDKKTGEVVSLDKFRKK